MQEDIFVRMSKGGGSVIQTNANSKSGLVDDY